jgi:predicted DNA-binding transcriptional regulator YafY
VIPWLLGWGAHAEILQPASLRQRLAEEAAAMAAQYRADLSLLS